MAGLNIRLAQRSALLSMLSLNGAKEAQLRQSDKSSGDTSKQLATSHWKLFIYDDECRDIVSPLLDVPTLQRHGVTLHMSLSSAGREAVPDVPAVYFIAPTAENARLVARDCARGLYDAMYLNFCRPCPRPVLEALARGS